MGVIVKNQSCYTTCEAGRRKNEFNALVDSGKIDKSYRLTSGYANTYGRLIADQPSPTITNNLTTVSSLRCIHYSQNRALTPREGARIQSFPDWYKFEDSNRMFVHKSGMLFLHCWLYD